MLGQLDVVTNWTLARGRASPMTDASRLTSKDRPASGQGMVKMENYPVMTKCRKRCLWSHLHVSIRAA